MVHKLCCKLLLIHLNLILERSKEMSENIAKMFEKEVQDHFVTRKVLQLSQKYDIANIAHSWHKTKANKSCLDSTIEDLN